MINSPILINSDGIELSVKDGLATNSNNSGIIILGSDGSEYKILKTDNTGSIYTLAKGLGTAGSPDTGVITIQGITSGTPVIVSGTVTANIGTTNGLALDSTLQKLTISQGTALGSNTQILIGGSVSTAAPTYTNGQINPLSITTGGLLRVDGSATTQPVSGTVAATQSGTWTVQPGNTANTTPWLFTINQNSNSAIVNSSTPTTSDNALVVSISPNSYIAANATNSGTLGSLNATVQLTISGKTSVGMQLSSGTLIGTIKPQISVDAGSTWVDAMFYDPTTGNSSATIVFSAANTATTRFISKLNGVSHVRIIVSSYTSGSASCALQATQAVDNTTSFMGTTALAVPPNILMVGGKSSAVARPMKVDKTGNVTIRHETTLAIDEIEGSTVNSWLWTQSTSTMTISQATAVLTLNNNSTLTNGTYAIITSNRQYQVICENNNKLTFIFAPTLGPTNAVIEVGYGAPSGATATIADGLFFRINGTSISCVTSFNSSETTYAQSGTLTSGNYYTFTIVCSHESASFIIEDASSIPVVDVTVSAATAVAGLISVTHLPAFARVRNAAGVASAAKIGITSFNISSIDVINNKPIYDQLAGAGRNANVVPTTFAQAAQLAAGAAPSTSTPTNSGVAYTTLGGEFSLNATATSENLLGVFGYTVPSPYTLFVTDIFMPPTIVTSVMGAAASLHEWCLMVASSTNPSTATGYRNTIGLFTAASGAGAGTVFNGTTLSIRLQTPIVILPGQVLLVLVKIINGPSSGVYRGSIFINGYYE